MSAAVTLADCPVVILAGGLGTRLQAVVSDRPKALAPVGDRSFLEIQISLLRDQGARQFVLCVGHRASQIHDCLGDGTRLGVHVEYSIESEQLLGTGGALRLAARFFKPCALVLNGDTFLATDYSQILRHHVHARAAAKVAATVTLSRLEETARFGSVVLDSAGKFIQSFNEKVLNQRSPCWLNAGAYVIEGDLLARITPNIACSLERDVFPSALGDGLPIAAHRTDQPFFDIGTAEDFRRFCRLYEEGELSRLLETARRRAS